MYWHGCQAITYKVVHQDEGRRASVLLSALVRMIAQSTKAALWSVCSRGIRHSRHLYTETSIVIEEVIHQWHHVIRDCLSCLIDEIRWPIRSTYELIRSSNVIWILKDVGIFRHKIWRHRIVFDARIDEIE